MAIRARDLTTLISTWTAKDRKSTRLNSSHLVISYAVFCLKKKKKAHFLLGAAIRCYRVADYATGVLTIRGYVGIKPERQHLLGAVPLLQDSSTLLKSGHAA